MKTFIVKFLSALFRRWEYLSQNYTYKSYRKKYNIHPSFFFNGKDIKMYGDGEINIAEDSYIGRYSNIQTSKGYKVNIGKNCSIGPFFCIWTESTCVDFDYNKPKEVKPKLGNVIINDAVWIGANVLISSGVTIGENSIIGANSVVTHDVPPFAIVGGVPARIIRYKNIT